MTAANHRLGRLFGDLKVRPKLMVLHNAFFLVLTCAVYFSLMPLLEQRVLQARAREINLITRLFSQGTAHAELAVYGYRQGEPDQMNVPPSLRAFLLAHPGVVRLDPADPSFAFRYSSSTGQYSRVRLPYDFYAGVMAQARWTLLAVLGLVYVFAVLMLELLVMPRYLYRPIRAIVRADEAVRLGQRDAEMVEESEILGDEIGQIMRSRNASMAELRRHEDELRRHEEELKTANEDLTRKNHMLETARRSMVEQDRLASLGMLSASVAHEMNTPLAVLQGSIEQLLEKARDAATSERLARMLRVAGRLRKISESLLDFARVRKDDFSPIPLRHLIEESWGLVGIDEKAIGVCFENQVPEDARIHGNQDRLVQVFVNLLRNALNAVSKPGSVRVRTEARHEEGRCVRVIAVEDNGPGIPEDVLPHIFDAFVTTRLDARGTGLGLTVAEGIVQQHHGSITASNRPEGGARLEVRLPMAPEPLAGADTLIHSSKHSSKP
ncbi:MAG: GHKL domain-containing protein [Bryobacterales bacterium]|nr:GHKL domain-containing protein [Bryobacterales bacterium]